jgi:hypothetical protein
LPCGRRLKTPFIFAERKKMPQPFSSSLLLLFSHTGSTILRRCLPFLKTMKRICCIRPIHLLRTTAV